MIHIDPLATDTDETMVLYRNVLSEGTLSASSETADGAAANALGPQTFDSWTPSAVPATLAVTLSDGVECDCAAIIAHTLGSAGATALVQYGGDSRTNLIVRSQELDNAAWNKQRVTVSADAIVAPNGTLTADKLVEVSGQTGWHGVNTPLVDYVSGTNYTLSAYVKAAERGFVQLVFINTTHVANMGARFDLATGDVLFPHVGLTDYGCEDAGNGWWRVWISAPASVTISSRSQIQMATGPASGDNSYTGDGTSGLYVWGVQLESQPNLFSFPNEFDNSYWTKAAVTVDPDATTAPDGTMTADRVVASAAAGPHHIRRFFSYPAGTVVTLSGVFKWNGTHVDVVVSNFNALGNIGFGAVFDLQNGTIISQYNMSAGVILGADIAALGNDWYRCSITGFQEDRTIYETHFAAHNGTTRNFTGDGVSGFYAWGAHLRDHRVPLLTSYIPTVASAVTSDWHDASGWIVPADNSDILALFPPIASDRWRIQTTRAVASIGVAMIGPRLLIPWGVTNDYTPLNLALEIETNPAVSRGGHFIGSRIKSIGAATSVPLALQEREWIEGAAVPFIAHYNSGQPFVFASAPGVLGDDMGYVWRSGGALAVSYGQGARHGSMSLEVAGYIGGLTDVAG